MLRVDRLRNFLQGSKYAALISCNENVYYFTGFNNSEGLLLVASDCVYLLVDFRYFQAALDKSKNCKVIQCSNFYTELKSLLNKHSIDTLLIESSHTTLSVYERLIKNFNSIGVSVVSNGSLDKVISNLRMIKDKDEINFIQRAQQITEKAYTEVLNYVKPGVKEKDISIELEYLIKKYGAEDISFDLITISGKNTSLPHGVPSDNVILTGDFFTFDIGAIFNGYHSDMTRTVAVQEYSDDMKNIYDIVLNAQLSALNRVKSGILSSEVDKTARDVISKAGYGDFFGHSTGHGVGINIHEMPNISPNDNTLLSAGMVITIEPGIYINNKFGVRIEDMVLVEDSGFKNFATLSKELIVV